MDTLRSILNDEPLTEVHALDLASILQNKQHDKYDSYLDEYLLSINYASYALDIPRALELIAGVTAAGS